jgi:hypothetical protein
MGEVVTDPAIDYRQKSFEHGQYRMNMLKQVTGGDTVTLGAVTQTSIFEIPAKVFNFAKTSLSFGITSTATAAAANAMTFFATGCPAIDRIQLYTRGGVYLCDIPDFGYFLSAVAPLTTKFIDYINTPTGSAFNDLGGAAAVITGMPSPPVGIIQPAYAIGDSPQLWGQPLSSIDGAAHAVEHFAIRSGMAPGNRRYLPADTPRITFETAAAGVGIAQGYGGAALSPMEQRYWYDNCVSATATGANPGVPAPSISYLNCKLDFGKIPHCILSANKDLFFGETLLLQITWGTAATVGCQLAKATGVLVAPFAACTVNRLALFLAVEVNRYLVEMTIKQAASGWRMVMPYLYVNRYQKALNDAQTSIQIRLNRGHGMRLLKVYHTAWREPAVDTAVSIWKHDSPLIQTLYTLLDNERLQDNNLTIANYDDWLYMEPLLRGSAVVTPESFHYNFVWVDDWTGAPTCEWQFTDLTECGLPLDQERLWNIMTTNPVPLAMNRTFFVTQKFLTVMPNQISFV